MNRITALKKRVEDKLGGEKVWFFPSRGNVSGYEGTGLCERYGKKVMFVAERPSTGRWGQGGKTTEAIRMFYDSLKKFNLENAHLTDFIKTRAKAGQWSYDDIKENLEIFEDEFEAINPDVIIALGQNSFTWLSLYLIMRKSNLKPYRLMHYSQRKDVESYKDKFIKNLKEITDKIQNIASS